MLESDKKFGSMSLVAAPENSAKVIDDHVADHGQAAGLMQQVMHQRGSHDLGGVLNRWMELADKLRMPPAQG